MSCTSMANTLKQRNILVYVMLRLRRSSYYNISLVRKTEQQICNINVTATRTAYNNNNKTILVMTVSLCRTDMVLNFCKQWVYKDNRGRQDSKMSKPLKFCNHLEVFLRNRYYFGF